jgi:hypothetical protein
MLRLFAPTFFLGLTLILGCVTRPESTTSWDPPAMSLQHHGDGSPTVVAEQIQLNVDPIQITLHLSEGWDSSGHRLALHFHTSPAFALREHQRAGYRFPLVSVMLGSGSARYRTPFLDPTLLPRILQTVEGELRSRHPSAETIRDIDITSFSAGYGAVRELVQQTGSRSRIRRILLSDSLYAGLVSGADGSVARVVQPDQIECWFPFARDAVAGRTTFVLTHSQIPTPSYASTAECATALMAAMGLQARIVPPDAGRWPLISRCDAGQFHLWGYGGTDANAHLVHPRTAAEVWRTLDAVHPGGEGATGSVP